MCALTLKSDTTEIFSRALSSPLENPLCVCINLLKENKVGYLIKLKIKERAFGQPKDWIMEQGKDIQYVLIGMRGLKNKQGNFICVMNGHIFDGLYKTSMPLETNNFEYVLGEM